MRTFRRYGAVMWSLAGLGFVLLVTQVAAEDPTASDLPTSIRAAIDSADWQKAEELARVHLAETEDTETIEYARALDLLVEAVLLGGKANDDESLRIAQQAVELKEELLSADDPELARSLLMLGRLHLLRGDATTAVSYIRRSLAIEEETTLVWSSLGSALLASGDLEGAERAYRREGEWIAKVSGPRSMEAAGHAYNTARVLMETGNWEEALVLYRKAAGIVESNRGVEDARYAYALLGVANVLAFLGDTTAALEAHERVLATALATMRPDHPFVASCRTGLGYAQERAGDFEAARQTFSGAYEIARNEYGPDHEATGRALRLLGAAERKMGDLEKAEIHLTEAKAILSQFANEIPLLEARVEYAAVLADRDRLEKAIVELQAVHEAATTSLPDHALTWDIGLGELMLRAQRAEEAREILRASVDGLAERWGEDYHRHIEALAQLALASARTGRPEEALELAARTETLEIDRARLLIAGLSERQALRYAEERTSTLDLLLSLAAEASESARVAAWNAVIRSRGAVLDELARRRRAVAEVDDAEAANKFAGTSRTLANLLVHGPSGDREAYRRALDDARRRREEAERELARLSRDFRSIQAEREADLDGVREALPDNAALIAYVAYTADPHDESEYAAFVLRHGGTPQFVPLGAASKTDRAVESYRRALQQGILDVESEGESAFHEASVDLRRLVWDPLSKLIGEARYIFVVPEGELHLVSFATFPRSRGGYLADSGRYFHYLSAERDLAAEPPAARGRGLLIVGDPDYGDTSQPQPRSEPSSCATLGDIRFARLPGTDAEARSLAKLWTSAHESPVEREVTLLTGSAASERSFKQEAPGRRVLHVATHGFFLGGPCSGASDEHRGVGGLSPRPGAGKPQPVETSLALSGLALAGANRRTTAEADAEDGIVTAEEIATLDLIGTEWAVLSACDTALGEVRQGEGVFGLRRAFRVAGARTLIMTLWPVRDDVTAEWMKQLYEARLEARLDTAAAVAAATRAVLGSRREEGLSTHPAIWGAFVASGDWR